MKTIDREISAKAHHGRAKRQLLGALAVSCALFIVSTAWATDCESLTGRSAGFGVVVKAQHFGRGEKIGAGPLPWVAPRPFCRLQARLTPAAGSDIQVEVWLPDPAGWNGKLLGAGNGGYAGTLILPYLDMFPALGRGYAAAGTDMGNETPFGTISARWAYGHPQKLIDWAYRANHLTTLFAKAMIRAYYGNAPRRSYFHGCSDGGHEALMEASRYPADYDGIIAGAPASPWTRTMTDFIWNYQALNGAPGAELNDSDLKLLHSAVLARCDALDGVKDGIVSYPPACNFNPAVLLCKPGERQSCLNAAQVRAVERIYQGARADGVQISSGFAPGSELNWNPWIIGSKSAQTQFGTEFFRWIVYKDPNWTPTGSDIGRDFADAEQRTGRMLNSDSPDLRAFVRRGGKLLLYQGWADPAIPPGNMITYYDALTKELGAGKDQVRLFMVPGMSHCGWGNGLDVVLDTVGPLNRWVEDGVAPERLLAPAKALMPQPICAWPKRARWMGNGNIGDAATFVCAAPHWADTGARSKDP
ncbi:MAG TPA: tannase/feruloyl esterase family alpha/beta hydrolase [Steroidobacteraceae bacterium]|nr:tannase/feruloyl esterase family alpha/beta hydrolase [Steroidobacteraceae bacterium]